jgi:hypothetical protein|tara:strand:+ start:63170 stop:63289 length:120 start_codon:yes stop_codon:yes gene_type:complete
MLKSPVTFLVSQAVWLLMVAFGAEHIGQFIDSKYPGPYE